jgi:hypothetical protein
MSDPCGANPCAGSAWPPLEVATPPSLVGQDQVFAYVHVDFLVRGGGRVSWDLRSSYTTPGPYQFQLQAASTWHPAAADWVNVGGPVENACLAYDPERRARGHIPTTHYRVVLTDAAGTHTSAAVPVGSRMGYQDWALAQELVRKYQLALDLGDGTAGWLYKRIRAGGRPASTDARIAFRDPWSGAITRDAQTVTFGTDFAGGYYAPIPFAVALDPSGTFEDIDPTQRGNIDDVALVQTGWCLAVPQLNSRDVFVSKGSDTRYALGKIEYLAMKRDVPLLAKIELHCVPTNDILYELVRPDV